MVSYFTYSTLEPREWLEYLEPQAVSGVDIYLSIVYSPLLSLSLMVSSVDNNSCDNNTSA